MQYLFVYTLGENNTSGIRSIYLFLVNLLKMFQNNYIANFLHSIGGIKPKAHVHNYKAHDLFEF